MTKQKKKIYKRQYDYLRASALPATALQTDWVLPVLSVRPFVRPGEPTAPDPKTVCPSICSSLANTAASLLPITFTGSHVTVPRLRADTALFWPVILYGGEGRGLRGRRGGGDPEKVGKEAPKYRWKLFHSQET